MSHHGDMGVFFLSFVLHSKHARHFLNIEGKSTSVPFT